MNWHYAEDNGAQGPVPDAEFEALVRAGRVQPTTLIWHEGMTNWLPLSQVAPEVLAAAALPPATGDAAPAAPIAKLSLGEVVCAECGQRFPRAATVQTSGNPAPTSFPQFTSTVSPGSLNCPRGRPRTRPAPPRCLTRLTTYN